MHKKREAKIHTREDDRSKTEHHNASGGDWTAKSLWKFTISNLQRETDRNVPHKRYQDEWVRIKRNRGASGNANVAWSLHSTFPLKWARDKDLLERFELMSSCQFFLKWTDGFCLFRNWYNWERRQSIFNAHLKTNWIGTGANAGSGVAPRYLWFVAGLQRQQMHWKWW